MGYSAQQVTDLEETINDTNCDLVLIATPIDLTNLVTINKPTLRVQYEYKDNSEPTLEAAVKEFFAKSPESL
jgi:predicted GTPase